MEPFEFEPAREYASDDEADSDRDSNDSNDPEHPACDYPDEVSHVFHSRVRACVIVCVCACMRAYVWWQ